MSRKTKGYAMTMALLISLSAVIPMVSASVKFPEGFTTPIDTTAEISAGGGPPGPGGPGLCLFRQARQEPAGARCRRSGSARERVRRRGHGPDRGR